MVKLKEEVIMIIKIIHIHQVEIFINRCIRLLTMIKIEEDIISLGWKRENSMNK